MRCRTLGDGPRRKEAAAETVDCCSSQRAQSGHATAEQKKLKALLEVVAGERAWLLLLLLSLPLVVVQEACVRSVAQPVGVRAVS